MTTLVIVRSTMRGKPNPYKNGHCSKKRDRPPTNTTNHPAIGEGRGGGGGGGQWKFEFEWQGPHRATTTLTRRHSTTTAYLLILTRSRERLELDLLNEPTWSSHRVLVSFFTINKRAWHYNYPSPAHLATGCVDGIKHLCLPLSLCRVYGTWRRDPPCCDSWRRRSRAMDPRCSLTRPC